MMLRQKTTQWVILVIGVGLYLYFPVISLWGRLNNNDFKHIYLGMKALVDGNSPYPIQSLHHQAALQGYQQISLNPYVYLPFTGYSMVFLAPFTLAQAVSVWFIVNHLFVAVSLLIISQMFRGWRIGATGLLFLALALNDPLYRTLSAGQLNLELLFLITLGWYLLKKGKHGTVGSLMAFAALFKLMPGIYGLYFLLRKKWKALIFMALTGTILLLVSVALAGIDIYAQFIPVLKQMSYGRSTWPHVFSFWDDPANQSINSFISHLVTSNDHTRPWKVLGQPLANSVTWACTLSLLAAYVFLCWRKNPGATLSFSPEDEAAWMSTLLMGLLIPSLLWDHYLVMIILPVAWLIKAGISLKRYAAVATTLVCYALTCVSWNYEAHQWQSGLGIMLMSLKLWPTLILFGLTLCFIRWSVEIVSEDDPDIFGTN